MNKNNIKIKNKKTNKIFYKALQDFKILRQRKDFESSYLVFHRYHILKGCIGKSNIYITLEEALFINHLLDLYKRLFYKITKISIWSIE